MRAERLLQEGGMQEIVSRERMAYELWNARSEDERAVVQSKYRCLDADEEDGREPCLEEA